MTLKINKACDLSSISVLPPHSRRSSAPLTGLQASLLRSQTSQQSFSQSISSQHGSYSQLSQTSLDDTLINDQRYNSQERENSGKACYLPSISYTRDEAQIPVARSSADLVRKWNPASIRDKKCCVNEELEHRIAMVETSINKFGMILDSVQSDIMHVSKGTKEVSLEMDSLRQKLATLDNTLHLVNKGQEAMKQSIDGSLKSISEQLSKNLYHDKLLQISMVLSALPAQMEASFLKLQRELCLAFTKEMQAVCSLEARGQKSPSLTMHLPRVSGFHSIPQKYSGSFGKLAMSKRFSGKEAVAPKVEMGNWNSVKLERPMFTHNVYQQENMRVLLSPAQQEQQSKVIIESDEEIDLGFSCLINDKEQEFGNDCLEEAKEETERILRKARKKKRKYNSVIIIN